jgi:hypothetical protein
LLVREHAFGPQLLDQLVHLPVRRCHDGEAIPASSGPGSVS